MLEALPPGIRETFRIVERDELDALGTDPPVQHANPGMSHGHHPDHPDMNTGLVAGRAVGLEFSAPDGELYAGLLE